MIKGKHFNALTHEMHSYISKFSQESIMNLEEQDLQFLSLQNARKKISTQFKESKINQNIFLFLILQNGLISYQVAGSGENRWEEFSQKIIKDRKIITKKTIQEKNNINRRYDFLITSKYNKRIYNIKKCRLIRFNKFLETHDLKDPTIFLDRYHDMEGLLETISQTMNKSKDSKTLTFTIKMFGYGARIVFKEKIKYPHNIKIPIDSRLKKIYEKNTGNKAVNTVKSKEAIVKYFEDLSKKHQIAPLHLDSILRIDYRKKINL